MWLQALIKIFRADSVGNENIFYCFNRINSHYAVLLADV